MTTSTSEAAFQVSISFLHDHTSSEVRICVQNPALAGFRSWRYFVQKFVGQVPATLSAEVSSAITDWCQLGGLPADVVLVEIIAELDKQAFDDREELQLIKTFRSAFDAGLDFHQVHTVINVLHDFATHPAHAEAFVALGAQLTSVERLEGAYALLNDHLKPAPKPHH